MTNSREKKQLVLIVDDQPKVLRFIELILKLRGFDVATAISGAEALDLVKSAKPDIMLLDMMMPEIDGLEVLRRLRTFTRLPVIAFSSSYEFREDAIRIGADDFMNKPFRNEEMIKKVEQLIAR